MIPKKIINLKENKIDYILKKSRRAKRMRLVVYCDGNCVVTVPHGFSMANMEKFILEKSDWIRRKVNYFKKRNFNPVFVRSSKREYQKLKLQALQLTENRIAYFNQIYNFSYNKISIRNQKTRWGSCSKKGNLSFNCKIALLPENIADYIIVHELCHLQEFNHSPKFWRLVEKTILNHKEIRKKLRYFWN
jgi:predicted metal-dependent hydrolase